MKIVGCDLHTRYHQIAMLDEETGELVAHPFRFFPPAAEWVTQFCGEFAAVR